MQKCANGIKLVKNAHRVYQLLGFRNYSDLELSQIEKRRNFVQKTGGIKKRRKMHFPAQCNNLFVISCFLLLLLLLLRYYFLITAPFYLLTYHLVVISHRKGSEGFSTKQTVL